MKLGANLSREKRRAVVTECDFYSLVFLFRRALGFFAASVHIRSGVGPIVLKCVC